MIVYNERLRTHTVYGTTKSKSSSYLFVPFEVVAAALDSLEQMTSCEITFHSVSVPTRSLMFGCVWL